MELRIEEFWDSAPRSSATSVLGSSEAQEWGGFNLRAEESICSGLRSSAPEEGGGGLPGHRNEDFQGSGTRRSEPIIVNLLRSPEIDSHPVGPV
jgi:hypothetical protein